MKKLIILIFTLSLAYLSYAQKSDFSHELFASYGVSPLIHESFSYPGNFWGKPTFSLLSENKRAWGVVNIGYSYSLSKNYSMGLSYSYSTSKIDYRLPNAAFIDATREDRYHIVMPYAKYQWFTHRLITLYSKAGIGVIFGKCKVIPGPTTQTQSTTEKGRFFAWHLSPIGVEFGKSAAVFFEGGVGTMGYVQVGVKLKL